jgi:hypothetical protein
MVESPFTGTPPATRARRGRPAETGTIARILASPATSDYVRTWLKAALDRDPLLAYQEAATLAGMLELLSCEEARAWLLPALTAGLHQDPEVAFRAALDMAAVLKPAAMVLQELEERPPEPANCRGVPVERTQRGMQLPED